MQLKDVLDGTRGQLTLQRNFSKAHTELKNQIEKAQLKVDCEELAKKLTNIYYGTEKAAYQTAKQAYVENYLAENKERIISVLSTFSLDNMKIHQRESQSYVNSKTLENKIRQARSLVDKYQKLCKDLGENNTPERQKVESILTQINDIIAEGDNIIKDFSSKRIIGKYEEAATVINKLAAFIDFHVTNGSRAQANGDFFEKALASFAEEITNANIDNLVFKELKESFGAQLGQVPIQRGDFGPVQINTTVSVEEALKIAGVDSADKLNKQRYTKNEDGTITISYTFNPSSPKQGKMDVLIGYKDSEGNPIRASAKHWSKGSGDLGETSIAAGLARQSGTGLFNDYLLAVLKPTSDQRGDQKEVPEYVAASVAHEYAKLALKADIAMGLNQGIDNASQAGYANLLIIDRGDSIVVKDLSAIVLNEQLEKYADAGIEASAISIYNKMKDKQFSSRTYYYRQQMIPVLDKMKVTIKIKTVKTNIS